MDAILYANMKADNKNKSSCYFEFNTESNKWWLAVGGGGGTTGAQKMQYSNFHAHDSIYTQKRYLYLLDFMLNNPLVHSAIHLEVLNISGKYTHNHNNTKCIPITNKCSI